MQRFIKEVIRYGVIGLTATAADVAVYASLTRLSHLPALDANLIAYLVGHTVSFFGNRRWTFRSSAHPLGEYRRFWAVTAIGLAISQGVLALGIGNGFSDVYAKAAAVILSGLWNFSLHRLWTFKNRQK